MVSTVDPAPRAAAAVDIFLTKLESYAAPASTTLGEERKLGKVPPSKEADENVLRSLTQNLTAELRATGAAQTPRSVERARHNRFILIMAVSIVFLCAVVAISYFARENIATALFGSGGVCVAFVGFLKFAMDQQLEDHRIEVNARIVDLFERVVGQVDSPPDLIRISETFAAVLRERSTARAPERS